MNLPGGIEKEIPIIPLWVYSAVKIGLVLLLLSLILVICYLIYWKFFRTNESEKQFYGQILTSYENALKEIDTAYRSSLKNETFRTGLHLFSATLKSFLMEKSKKNTVAMTASELINTKLYPEALQVFLALEILQFGQNSADENQFTELYNKTKKALQVMDRS